MSAIRRVGWALLAILAFGSGASAQEPARLTVVETVDAQYERATHAGVRRSFRRRQAVFREWNCWEPEQRAACVRAYGSRVVRVDVHQQHAGCSPVRDRNGRVTGSRYLVRPAVLVEVYGTDGSLISASQPRQVGPDEELATVVEESIRAVESLGSAHP